MDAERTKRLVIQAAETSRLLGVDFVPVFRRTHSPQVDATARHISQEARAPASVEVEAKPASAQAGDTLYQREDPGPRPTRDPAESRRRLDELRARYERDAPHQHFVTDHHSIVFGEGDPCARLMFVGEAPGAEEDRTGRPFVGPAGQLLNKMITAMGFAREQVYIANVLKTRPPNNATPTTEEIEICAPYLFEQIGIIGPEAIVTLGLPASRALLNTSDSMGRMRGRWANFLPPPPYDARPIPVMPTYHPAFLLRSYTPENRAKVWSDLKLVMDRLGLAAPKTQG